MKIISKLMMLSALSFVSVMAMEQKHSKVFYNRSYEENREEALKPEQLFNKLENEKEKIEIKLNDAITKNQHDESIIASKKKNGIPLSEKKINEYSEKINKRTQYFQSLIEKSKKIEYAISNFHQQVKEIQENVRTLTDACIEMGTEECALNNYMYSVDMMSNLDNIEKLLLKQAVLQEINERMKDNEKEEEYDIGNTVINRDIKDLVEKSKLETIARQVIEENNIEESKYYDSHDISPIEVRKYFNPEVIEKVLNNEENAGNNFVIEECIPSEYEENQKISRTTAYFPTTAATE